MKEQLKTLKDLPKEESEYKGDYSTPDIELKQEAIKHIKILQSIGTEDIHLRAEIFGKIGWIKHFFNLTEVEDKVLKDNE